MLVFLEMRGEHHTPLPLGGSKSNDNLFEASHAVYVVLSLTCCCVYTENSPLKNDVINAEKLVIWGYTADTYAYGRTQTIQHLLSCPAWLDTCKPHGQMWPSVGQQLFKVMSNISLNLL